MAKTFTHKLGKTRAGEGTRIWLEGQRLLDHGFTHGAHVKRIWWPEKQRLTLMVIDAATFEQLPRNERCTVAGSAARPILDIVGEAVRDTFPTGTVEAGWSQGRVYIKGV